MRIAYTTTFDAKDVHNWSGTPFHMARAFQTAGMTIDFVGNLVRKLPPLFKAKQALSNYVTGQRESPRFNVTVAKQYSLQVEKQLKRLSSDVILSPLINPIAYLECKQPIVLWTDALYAALLGFYPPFASHSARSIKQGNQITREALSRCKLAIFSSQWAANSAVELYGVNRNKVHVVPFGANIENYPTQEDMRYIVKKRSHSTIKLLFLAKSWDRKGGDTVIQVAKALNNAGHRVDVSIVGTNPKLESLPDFVHCAGFLSKRHQEGRARLAQYFHDAHFLFLPARAEACPMVFAEANAYGMPILTSQVGGISTAVKDNVNGMTFSFDAPIATYCDYIVNTIHDRKGYETLALSSYNEFITRLNWRVAIDQVKDLMRGI